MAKDSKSTPKKRGSGFSSDDEDTQLTSEKQLESEIPPWEMGGGKKRQKKKKSPKNTEMDFEGDTVITGKTSRVHADLFGGNETLFQDPPAGFKDHWSRFQEKVKKGISPAGEPLWIKFADFFEENRKLVFIFLGVVGLAFFLFFAAQNVRQPELATEESSPSVIEENAPEGKAIKNGNIRIVTKPPGATVFIDGVSGGGLTPLNIADLDPDQKYTLQVQKQGFDSIQTTLVLNSGETRVLRYDLLPLGFHLQASSVPVGAMVYLDGVKIGQSPLDLFINPRSEKFKIEIRMEGYKAYSHWVNASQKQVKINASLTRLDNQRTPRSLKPNYGFLSLEANPVALIYLNGKRLNQVTPIKNLKVPVGRHVIRFLNPQNQKSQVREVTVRRGDRFRMKVNLR